MLTSCTGSKRVLQVKTIFHCCLGGGGVGAEVKGNEGVVSSHNELIKCSCQEQLFAWLNC